MITIRSAIAGDEEPLTELIATIDNFSPEEKELAREVVRDGLASAHHGYHILVAINEAQDTLGFLCYGPIPITVQRWDLYWIAVAPDQGRQGVGSRLLAAMEEKLGPANRIYVDTSSTLGYAKARAFYERHGYGVICIMPDFYRPDDDKIVYGKEL